MALFKFGSAQWLGMSKFNYMASPGNLLPAGHLGGGGKTCCGAKPGSDAANQPVTSDILWLQAWRFCASTI